MFESETKKSTCRSSSWKVDVSRLRHDVVDVDVDDDVGTEFTTKKKKKVN